jgi:TonB family protein
MSPDRLWLGYPPRFDGPEDPEPTVALEMLVDRSGEPVALRIDPAANDTLARRIRHSPEIWLSTRFDRAWASDSPVLRRASLRGHFFRPPVPTSELERVAKFPVELYGTTGRVEAKIHVQADGTVSTVLVDESAHPRFESAVLAAFQKAKKPFEAGRVAGKPVPMQIKMNFRFASSGVQHPSEPYVFSERGSNRAPQDGTENQGPAVRLSIDPVYPLDLAAGNVSGRAKAIVRVDEQGIVRDVKITEATEPAFGSSLKAAMSAWRFEPKVQKGQPQPNIFVYEHRFSLGPFHGQPLSRAAKRMLDHRRKGRFAEAGALDALPSIRHRPLPIYPLERDGTGVSDEVTVAFFVDVDGTVLLPYATLFRDEAMAWSAVTAVSRWRFTPPLKDGQATVARLEVKVAFEGHAVDPTDKQAATD